MTNQIVKHLNNNNMDNFLAELLELCKKYQGQPKMANFIRQSLPAISQGREDKGRFVAEFKAIIGQVEHAQVQVYQGPKKEMKEIIFTMEDFEAPKIQPPVAPPVDSEVKGAQSKEPEPLEKEVFDIFNNGLEGAESLGLESFVKQAKAAGCEFKKQPKTVAEAWATFEKYARKKLQI